MFVYPIGPIACYEGVLSTLVDTTSAQGPTRVVLNNRIWAPVFDADGRRIVYVEAVPELWSRLPLIE